MKEKYALVTGGANGLGKAFVDELLKIGISTIVVDLPDTGLDKMSEDMNSKFDCNFHYYEYDLAHKENVIELAKRINQNYKVFLLINNVGLGGTSRFENVDVDYLNTIIQLNIMVSSVLSHQMIPNLKQQQQSYILNVSSMAAFGPMAFKTIYPASKVFIQYFSIALYHELKSKNIHVSVVYPGPIRTNGEVTKRINAQGKVAKMGVLSPQQVAEISIRQLFKKRKQIMLSRTNWFHWLLIKIIPTRIRLRMLESIAKKELNS